MSEQQNFIFTCKDEEELQKFKDKAVRLKVIVLDKMNKPPLINPKLFDRRDRKKFEAELKKAWVSLTDDEIIKEFNEIVCDRIFADGVDISTYPCLQTNGPELPEELKEKFSKLEEPVKTNDPVKADDSVEV